MYRSPRDEKEAEKAEANKIFEAESLRGLQNFLEDKLTGWEKVTVDIALIGASGSGKSTIVNAMRNLRPRDPGAAKVGSTETTMVPTKYAYVGNSNVALWDLPGFGTPNFKKGNYLAKVNAQKYDVFVVVTHARFTEDDEWIGQALMDMRKPVHFLRTKIDFDVCNEKENGKSKEEVLSTIRSQTIGTIKDHLHSYAGEVKLFLVSGKETDDYEFQEFMDTLLYDISSMQRQALLCGVHDLSKTMLDRKVAVLKDRMWMCALRSVLGTVLPIPSLSSSVDRSTVQKEIAFYKSFLGFDDHTLTKISRKIYGDSQQLRRELVQQYPWFKNDDESVLNMLQQNPDSEKKRKLCFVPILSGIFGGSLAARITKNTLHSVLESMKTAALEIIDKSVNVEAKGKKS